MLAVRYAALTALAVWLGGMVLLALVAPTTFSVLEGADPESGRLLAGSLFGEILRRFHFVAYACGGLLLLSLLAMKLVGPPPAAFFPRVGIVATMLAVAVYSGVPLTRQIERVQAEIAGPVSALDAADPRRVRFDRLHQTSTSLMTVNMALGLVLLFWYVRET